MAQEDTLRFEKEMKELKETGYFTDKNGVHSSKLVVKSKRGDKQNLEVEVTLQPKKVSVPFMFLVKDKSSKIIKENGFKSAAAAIKVLGQLWKEMTQEEKQPYIDMSAKDALRRDKQIKEMQELGYFTTEDGQKSTTLKPKVKKGRPSSQNIEKDGNKSTIQKPKV